MRWESMPGGRSDTVAALKLRPKHRDHTVTEVVKLRYPGGAPISAGAQVGPLKPIMPGAPASGPVAQWTLQGRPT